MMINLRRTCIAKLVVFSVLSSTKSNVLVDASGDPRCGNINGLTIVDTEYSRFFRSLFLKKEEFDYNTVQGVTGFNINANTVDLADFCENDPDTLSSVFVEFNDEGHCEIRSPYATFGDNNPSLQDFWYFDLEVDWIARPLPLGENLVRATAYTGEDCTGAVTDVREIQLTVMSDGYMGCPGAVVRFDLYDAQTDSKVERGLEPIDDRTICLPTHPFNIKASAVPCKEHEVKSVVLELTGPTLHMQMENKPPHMLYGDDNNGDIFGGAMDPGSYTLTATPYSRSRGRGSPGQPLEVNFEMVECPCPNPGGATTDFLVFDEDGRLSAYVGNPRVDPIVDPDDLRFWYLDPVTVEARVCDETLVGSVVFEVTQSYFEWPEDYVEVDISNEAPYTVDISGSYVYAVEVTVSATPYSGPDGSGTPGLSQEFSFLLDKLTRRRDLGESV